MTLRNVHLRMFASLGATLLMVTSSKHADVDLYTSKMIGDYLPKVKIADGQSVGLASSLLGESKATLVHFWATYDAESRAQNMAYKLYASKHPSISYQAVSVDVDNEVYQMTLELDGVEKDLTQVIVSSDQRHHIIDLCGLQKGMNSYLVDRSGKILLINPSTEELDRILEVKP